MLGFENAGQDHRCREAGRVCHLAQHSDEGFTLNPDMKASTHRTEAATTRLKIAIVGTGRMARLHLQALERVPTAHDVVAGHDVHTAAGPGLPGLARGRDSESFGDLLRAS